MEPQGEVLGLVGFSWIFLHDIFAGMFLLCFCCILLFRSYHQKHPKMELKIDEKMMSVAILKKVSENVPNIFSFSLIFQGTDVLKS